MPVPKHETPARSNRYQPSATRAGNGAGCSAHDVMRSSRNSTIGADQHLAEHEYQPSVPMRQSGEVPHRGAEAGERPAAGEPARGREEEPDVQETRNQQHGPEVRSRVESEEQVREPEDRVADDREVAPKGSTMKRRVPRLRILSMQTSRPRRSTRRGAASRRPPTSRRRAPPAAPPRAGGRSAKRFGVHRRRRQTRAREGNRGHRRFKRRCASRSLSSRRLCARGGARPVGRPDRPRARTHWNKRATRRCADRTELSGPDCPAHHPSAPSATSRGSCASASTAPVSARLHRCEPPARRGWLRRGAIVRPAKGETRLTSRVVVSARSSASVST